MTTRPEPVSVAQAVEREKERLLSQGVPGAIVTNVALSALVLALVAQGAPTVGQVSWFGGVCFAVLVRFAMWLAYRRRLVLAVSWHHVFALGMVLSGVAWGAGVVVAFAQADVALQMGVTATAICLAAGIAGTTLGTEIGVQLFVLFATMPYAVRFAFEPTILHRVVAAQILVFSIGTTLLARRNSRTLSELVTLRFQLAEQRDAAERANRAKSSFLAAASHDLRQPLNAIVLFTSALETQLPTAAAQRTHADLRRALDAMGRLFDTLLDISRLDAGVVVAKPRAMLLGPLVERLARQYEPLAHREGLSWNVETLDVTIRSDPALLETILHNLLSNALRYTRQGGVRLRVKEVGEQVRIDLVDTGIGIPKEEHEKVFLEFHQVGNPERDREKGLGLGLAIVRRLAVMLDHRIELESTPGQGSRFSLFVARANATEVVDEAPEPMSALDVDGLRVLVVDDQPDGRESLRALLDRWKCEVRVAERGHEALEVATGWKPEVVICDLRLRDGETGTAVLASLRTGGVDAAELLVSGDLSLAPLEGRVVMHKPLNPAKLRAFLRSVRRRPAQTAQPA